ncbi:hypothetical protein SAMN05444354_108206 [Stigmatella aurantiaca]|uniref:Uncharacterized protein n=1 Tax=Stigmatella aurantiaca TaxID=41 RepID=A0A1H7T0Q7_STIAU|nr:MULTISPECIES: hypothetical protein [Stigmatella]SEL77824.1 hypothetical protein SAMN05444354_108206 [Stigmatella aurantiaca]
MATTVQPVTVDKKKAYAPPQVRSERILVPDLFTPSCIIDPETGAC